MSNFEAELRLRTAQGRPMVDRASATMRRDIHVYRIGDVEPFFMIYQDAGATIRWWEKQITIAYYFQCDPEDIGSLDSGEDVITVCGNIVGSFDRPVELKRLFAESVK